MLPDSLSFEHLKRRVPIEVLLAHQGLLSRLRIRGPNLVGPCPLHQGDCSDAFVVHREKNLWRCFTACQAGGDVVTLVRRLHTCSFLEAARLLAQLDTSGPSSLPLPKPASPPPFHPFTQRLLLQPDARFLLRKGILPSIAARYEVGLYHARGFLEGCIAVRLHAPNGEPLGYLGRRMDPHMAQLCGKWKCPPRLPVGQLLYGWHRLPLGCDRLVLVECPWGVLRLAQIGHPAVALLGLNLTSFRLNLLATMARVTLLLDGDKAGRSATQSLADQLSKHTSVRTLNLSDGADPDDLDDAALSTLIAE